MEGIYFHEVFSHVVKRVSIRIMLALTSLLDLELEKLDVKTMFLNGDLYEDIYMEQPNGFMQQCKRGLVSNLKKSLYGMKQSPRKWYKKFDSFMVSQNYTRSEYNHCLYFKISNGSLIILVL